jgi:hypothetical protein
LDPHPIIDSLIQLFALITTPFNNTQFFKRTPSSTLQSGPMTTFGPITEFWCILAVVSTSTFPMILTPLAKTSGYFAL